jgi:hypothetical protein
MNMATTKPFAQLADHRFHLGAILAVLLWLGACSNLWDVGTDNPCDPNAPLTIRAQAYNARMLGSFAFPTSMGLSQNDSKIMLQGANSLAYDALNKQEYVSFIANDFNLISFMPGNDDSLSGLAESFLTSLTWRQWDDVANNGYDDFPLGRGRQAGEVLVTWQESEASDNPNGALYLRGDALHFTPEAGLSQAENLIKTPFNGTHLRIFSPDGQFLFLFTPTGLTAYGLTLNQQAQRDWSPDLQAILATANWNTNPIEHAAHIKFYSQLAPDQSGYLLFSSVFTSSDRAFILVIGYDGQATLSSPRLVELDYSGTYPAPPTRLPASRYEHFLYVPDMANQSVVVLDPAQNLAVVTLIASLSGEPHKIVRRGELAYVLNRNGGQVDLVFLPDLAIIPGLKLDLGPANTVGSDLTFLGESSTFHVLSYVNAEFSRESRLTSWQVSDSCQGDESFY